MAEIPNLKATTSPPLIYVVLTSNIPEKAVPPFFQNEFTDCKVMQGQFDSMSRKIGF